MKNGKMIMWSIVGLAVAIVGYSTYQKLVKKKSVSTKEDAIKVIMDYSPTSKATILADMGTEYLIARANAYLNAQTKFTFNGKEYTTSTGRAL